MLLLLGSTYTIHINPRTRTVIGKGSDGLIPSTRTMKEKKKKKKQGPSVFEIQKAIGVFDDNQRKQKNSTGNTLVDMLASTPIGQKENSIERKIREFSEWVVKQTEPVVLANQKKILILCLKILPVWIFFLLIASGVLKLPFQTPFLDNLFS
ncbi:hypothetical protein ZOSMA_1G00900 [Zostera marina]|uniref:Uncharacterized protein n=1 Tax=Zostera marina TaxID=29655 RepID=A0A0K9PMF0_ZOSMR|nr:hypothetical protein ZOSMA_1G00900 [Zostera marina]